MPAPTVRRALALGATALIGLASLLTGCSSSDDDGADDSYLGSYTLVDEEFGTEVTVSVGGGLRTIESNSLPNHETGAFPNSGNPNEIAAQQLVFDFPTAPTFTGDATPARVPGIGINGIAFEPDTAEEVTCDSGETYRIEALQDLYDLGLDMENAHVQPGGQYHYHGVSPQLVEAFATDADLVHVGFAADGHLLYYSKGGSHTSGYRLATEARTGIGCTYRGAVVDIDGTTPDGTYKEDWVHDDGAGDLDACNGATIDDAPVGGDYAYLVTDSYPFVPRCLNGEFTDVGPEGLPPGDGADPGAGGSGPGGPPEGPPPSADGTDGTPSGGPGEG